MHRCREDEPAVGRLANLQVPVICGICGQQLRRPGDLKYHKCTESQVDTVQCPTCQQWFKNSRGLVVHQRARHQTTLFLSLQLEGDDIHMGSLEQDKTGQGKCECALICVCCVVC